MKNISYAPHFLPALAKKTLLLRPQSAPANVSRYWQQFLIWQYQCPNGTLKWDLARDIVGVTASHPDNRPPTKPNKKLLRYWLPAAKVIENVFFIKTNNRVYFDTNT